MKWVFVGLILLIIISTFFIIRSNIFTIRFLDVYLEKISCVGNEEIKKSSNLLGQNFLSLNSSKAEDDLKRKFICIKSVTLSKYFPNKIRLNVYGREPVAILVVEKDDEATRSGILEEFAEASESGVQLFMDGNDNGGETENFVTDNEGIIYSSNIEKISAPKVYISGINLSLGQKIKGELISNTLKILEKLNLFGINTGEAKIYSERLLLINAMPKIIFRLDDKVDTQLASLQLILNQAKIDGKDVEFIDLRFDKPVVKLAPKK